MSDETRTAIGRCGSCYNWKIRLKYGLSGNALGRNASLGCCEKMVHESDAKDAVIVARESVPAITEYWFGCVHYVNQATGETFESLTKQKPAPIAPKSNPPSS